METPILDAIVSHNQKKRSCFHMPGHGGTAQSLSALKQVLPFDLTELPDTGSLFDGAGATARAEELVSELFGTAATLMSAGGCTLCIQTMLRLAAPEGGKVVFGRVVHRSAINAMALLDISPVWVMPDESAGQGFAGRISAESIAGALKANPDAKAVYITTPDYFGVLSDVKAIARAAESFGVPLLVDNAHGAHLPFVNPGLGPIAGGAAITADSAHKTLPVLTGGAWLNIARKDFVSPAREAMALFGSTSPSYLIMLSLDLCRVWLAGEGGDIIRQQAVKGEELKNYMRDIGLVLPEGECDPMRLAFLPECGGERAGEILRQRGIEPEYAGSEGVILILTPFNTEEDLTALRSALTEIKNEKVSDAVTLTGCTPLSQALLSPRQALLSPKTVLPVEKAAGQAAATPVCPCPPAIPLVIPGEVITENNIQSLKHNGFSAIAVVKRTATGYN